MNIKYIYYPAQIRAERRRILNMEWWRNSKKEKKICMGNIFLTQFVKNIKVPKNVEITSLKVPQYQLKNTEQKQNQDTYKKNCAKLEF